MQQVGAELPTQRPVTRTPAIQGPRTLASNPETSRPCSSRRRLTNHGSGTPGRRWQATWQQPETNHQATAHSLAADRLERTEDWPTTGGHRLGRMRPEPE